ncbi:MAG: HEAT repeat domain-containing protein [Acidimicrobiia bacterium]
MSGQKGLLQALLGVAYEDSGDDEAASAEASDAAVVEAQEPVETSPEPFQHTSTDEPAADQPRLQLATPLSDAPPQPPPVTDRELTDAPSAPEAITPPTDTYELSPTPPTTTWAEDESDLTEEHPAPVLTTDAEQSDAGLPAIGILGGLLGLLEDTPNDSADAVEQPESQTAITTPVEVVADPTTGPEESAEDRDGVAEQSAESPEATSEPETEPAAPAPSASEKKTKPPRIAPAHTIPLTRVGAFGSLLGLLEEDEGPRAPRVSEVPDVQETPAPSRPETVPVDVPEGPDQLAGPAVSLTKARVPHADHAAGHDGPSAVREPQYRPDPKSEPELAPPGVASTHPGPPESAPSDTDLAEFKESLESFDVARRSRALKDLMHHELDRPTVELVAPALADPDANLRHLALQVLERAPELLPLETLNSAAFDNDPIIRGRALSLAGRTGNLEALGLVGSRLLDETDESVIGSGILALAALARSTEFGESHLDRLCAAIGAIPGMGLSNHSRELSTLAQSLPLGDIMHRLGTDQDSIRAGAAVISYESDVEAAHKALSRLVTDSNPVARKYALAAGGSQLPGSATSTPDADSVAATEAVGEPHDQPVGQSLLAGLIHALDDPKPEIREQAASALGRLPRNHVIDWISKEVRRADPEGIRQLIDAASRLDITEVADVLATAVARVPADELTHRLLDTLRRYSPVRDVVQGWRDSREPRERISAIRLGAALSPDDTDTILQGFADANARVRVAAIEAASNRRLIDYTASALTTLSGQDSSRRVRLAALDALKTADPEDRLLAAQQSLRDDDPQIRQAGLSLLTGRSDEEFAILAAALRDAEPAVAHRAAAILTQHGGYEVLALLWGQMQHTEGAARDLTLDVLRQLDATALRRLALQTVDSPDEEARARGLAALTTLNDDRDVHHITEALNDQSVRVRLEVLRALSSTAALIPIEPLLKTLDDPEDEIRAAAVRTLAVLEDTSVLPQLVARLYDSSPSVRRASRDVLEDHRSEEVIELLFADLDHLARRVVAVHVLATMGRQIQTRLIAKIDDADDHLREVILSTFHSTGMVEQLIGDLRDPDRAVRKQALEDLSRVGDGTAVGPIAQLLSEPDPQIRKLAAAALGAIGDDRAIEPLREAFANDPDMEVVAAVEHAYRKFVRQ